MTGSADMPARGNLSGLALGAALVTVFLWASAFVGIRAVAPFLSPGPLTLGRLGVGFLALGVIVLLRRSAMPPRRMWPRILAIGVLWFGAYNLSLNTAERFVDAGTAAMLTNIGPILIAVLGGLFLGEGFPPRLLIGCVVAFGGAVVIGLATSNSTVASPNASLGVVLCVIAASAYAIGVTLQKPVVSTTPGLTLTLLSCLIGATLCLPFAPQLVTELGSAPPDALAWLVYLGLFPTAIGFTTWAYALSHTTAGRLGSMTYLVPAIAILQGWLLLGEVPPALALVGGAIAISGVVIARWAPAPKSRVLEVGAAD